jgi:N-acetylneuraminate synthase
MGEPTARIGNRRVGPGAPTYVVAELSGNHNGILERALELIERAAAAGVDAVKLQTYTPDTLTIDSDSPAFVIGPGSPWAGRRLYELYAEAATPWEWTGDLFAHAAAHDLDAFSTPFDATAVDFLEQLDPPAHKIASFELLDLELVATVARTGRPMLLSTGMADQDEIADAVAVARNEGAKDIVLLKCTSSYPAPPEEMNLRTIADLRSTFGVPVGLSDHTLDDLSTIAAVSLGACVIEKHITLDRSAGGPDAAFSLEPDELARLVHSVREVEAALGEVRYGPTAAEASSIAFRRSLFVVEDVATGELFTRENVRSIRPGSGLPPKALPQVLGKRAKRGLPKGTPLSWDLIG